MVVGYGFGGEAPDWRSVENRRVGNRELQRAGDRRFENRGLSIGFQNRSFWPILKSSVPKKKQTNTKTKIYGPKPAKRMQP